MAESQVPAQSRAPRSDERVDVARYLQALKRSRLLIAAVMIVMTGGVLAASLALPKIYKATTRVVLELDVSPLGSEDAESVRRRLATTEALLTSPQVLDRAASDVPGLDGDSIDGKVESAVDPEANIISIVGSSKIPAQSAQIANAVSTAFIRERTEVQRRQIERAREDLLREIDLLQARPDAAPQVAAIRDRLSALAVSAASAGADLQVAERAETTSAPASPRPVRNAILALFGSFALGVLIALGRDQLTPRVSSTRELGRLLDLPVLVGVPFVRQRMRRRRRGQIMSGVEAESYDTLRGWLQFNLPRDRQHMILVTGALHGEGKTTATGRLGLSLARSGSRVLVLTADLRVPRMHEMFGLKLGVGLSDLVAMGEWDQSGLDDDMLVRAVRTVYQQSTGTVRRGELQVITSGTKASDPGRLIASQGMARLLADLHERDYDYILIDAPPLLGLGDAQVLSRNVDAMLLVTRLDRMTLEHVAELRDTLDRIELRPLGLVVIGARHEISPYYMAKRPGSDPSTAIISADT